MNCKQARDLILTYDADDVMPSRFKKDFENHLFYCSSCQEYKVLVKRQSIDPFKDLSREQVPSEIWQNINAEILKSQKPVFQPSFIGFLEKLKRISFPQPRLVFASGISFVLIMLLAARIFVMDQRYELAQKDSQEQIEYSAYLLDDAEMSAEISEGYGAALEVFLLAAL